MIWVNNFQEISANPISTNNLNSKNFKTNNKMISSSIGTTLYKKIRTSSKFWECSSVTLVKIWSSLSLPKGKSSNSNAKGVALCWSILKTGKIKSVCFTVNLFKQVRLFFYSRKQKSLSGFQNDFWSLNAKNNNLVSWMFIPWSCLFGCSWWRRKKNSFEVDMCKRCRTGSHKMWHEMGLGPRFVSLLKHRQRAQHIKVHWSWRLIIFKCCTCLFSIFSYCYN